MRTAIFGTGGMGRELAEICQRSISATQLDMVFVVDEPGKAIDGIPVISAQELLPDDQLILAVGSSRDRRTLADRFPDQPIATVISSTSVVSPTAFISKGAALCDYTVINSRSKIGKHFIANCFSQISHDCLIGDFVTFAPRVSCNGWIAIGDGVVVGAGAVIRNGSPQRRLTIGEGSVIGMGAVVTKDVAPYSVVIGNPAQPRCPDPIIVSDKSL